MPPIGYVLSERDAKLIQQFLYTYSRQQRYVNAFGRPGDDKLDHEEMHTTEVYIARSPVAGIPALQSMGSTGIGDIPGSALCTVFKTSQSADLTQDVTGYQHTVYNLSTTLIPGDSWVIIVRDKYGKWYALQSMTSEEGEEQSTGPGWTAGLSNEDCLLLTVSNKLGLCSTVPDQSILLVSEDALTWEGLDDFTYSGGAGLVSFTRIEGHSLPTLTIGTETLIWDAAGIDVDGKYWIEFKGGTKLCGDPAGTGSGTGGARGACGSNTFTVRLTCRDCITDAPCQGLNFATATCVLSDHYGDCANTTGCPGPPGNLGAPSDSGIDTASWIIGCEGGGGIGISCVDGQYVLQSGTAVGYITSFSIGSPLVIVANFDTTSGEFCQQTGATNVAGFVATITLAY